MKKLLLINVVSDIGSTGRICTQLLESAQRVGFDTYFAYGLGKSSITNSYKISSGWLSLHLHGFLGRKFGLPGYFSFFDTLSLIMWIRKVKPDVVHLHNLHGEYLNFKLLFRYLKRANHKVIWTLHDCWPFTGGCSHFTSYNCYKWIDDCNNCEFMHRIYKGNVYANSAKVLADKKNAFSGLSNFQVFTVSKWLENTANKSILKDYNIRTIYNGINMQVFRPVTTNFRSEFRIEDKFIILGIASIWSDGKGFMKFIELSKELTNDFIVVLVGLSEEKINMLPQNIIGFSGTNNSNRLAEFYSAADVFVNFSFEETFGLTVAESLSCGTPAIVMNSTACPEVVDENTGIVLNAYEVQDVIRALEVIRNNGKEFYSNNCRNRVLENFSLDNMLKLYVNEYCSN